MTSATLYREGPDLDALLAELDAEHGGNVQVVDVVDGRDGGVMGFFARRTVGVHFVVTSEDASPVDASPVDEAGSPLEAMLRAAEAAEMVESGRAPAASEDAGDNVEFARMLLEMATQKAAERSASVTAEPAPLWTPVPVEHAPVMPAPVATAPVATAPVVTAPVVTAPVGTAPVGTAPVGTAPVGTVPVATAPVAPVPVVAAPVATAPVVTPPAAPVSAADFAASRAELLEKVRVRPVGAHRVADEETPAPAPLPGDSAAEWRAVARQSSDCSPVLEQAPAPVAPSVVVPAAPQPVPVVPEPAASVVLPANPTRSPLTLRRQLSEIGVPLSWIPDDSASAYAVIEQLVRQVPLAAPTDLGPGQLLVVTGPAAQAQAEAVRLAGRLRLDPSAIRTAGCGSEPIRHRRQAAALELEVRGTRTEPCIVVVATDSSADLGGAADLAWAAEIVAALAPDHLLLVVDATTRVTDARTTLAAFGAVSAIAIVSAARTASPAAMWELGVPVASLDGREATRGGWAALLIDRLTSLDGA